MSIKSCKLDDLIGINILVMNFSALNDFVGGIFFKTGNKEDRFIDGRKMILSGSLLVF